jgi:multiple sugar transport system substrate-binding protein
VLGWLPMPAEEEGAALNDQDTISMGDGWGWAISQTSQNAELAWEFVQFMGSADSISMYAKDVGGIPARLDATTTAFNAAMVEQVLPYQNVRPGGADYPLVSEQIQLATEKIMLGEATAEEAMQQFAEAVEVIVGAENVKRLE